MTNVLVHLEPAAVVARVMTGTAVLHDDAEPWLAREVAVVPSWPSGPTCLAFLGDRRGGLR